MIFVNADVNFQGKRVRKRTPFIIIVNVFVCGFFLFQLNIKFDA